MEIYVKLDDIDGFLKSKNAPPFEEWCFCRGTNYYYLDREEEEIEANPVDFYIYEIEDNSDILRIEYC